MDISLPPMPCQKLFSISQSVLHIYDVGKRNDIPKVIAFLFCIHKNTNQQHESSPQCHKEKTTGAKWGVRSALGSSTVVHEKMKTDLLRKLCSHQQLWFFSSSFSKRTILFVFPFIISPPVKVTSLTNSPQTQMYSHLVKYRGENDEIIDSLSDGCVRNGKNRHRGPWQKKLLFIHEEGIALFCWMFRY